ncbi:GntR family transcriptional regulator [Leeia oryzae]|uniref:GntR family transcriptional regulator n=1 Tax=Leeia oryzae TaxID=356662 RepID=UPI00035CC72B|nr:GntR family transcriptional regulator [Leeia oryzae]
MNNTKTQPLRRQDKLVHHKARQAILSMLEAPEFAEGKQIPAERDLATHLGISRMTLRKAIEQLISEGILERRGNRGTFVKAPDVQRPMSRPQSLSNLLETHGTQAGSTLLHFQTIPASTSMARQLQIPEGDALVVIRRLRSIDDVPFCIETSYIPLNFVPQLTASDLIDGQSLYQLLYTRYGLVMGSDEGEVRVVLLTDEESELLKLPSGSPALAYKGVILDTKRRPVEYLVSLNHPQRVSFKLSNPDIQWQKNDD